MLDTAFDAQLASTEIVRRCDRRVGELVRQRQAMGAQECDGGPSALSGRSFTGQHVAMVLEGNAISCDAYGCKAQDDFIGELHPDDIRVRYHVLGWRYSGQGDSEQHFCPAHLDV